MRFRQLNVWFFCALLFMFLVQTHTISWQIICVTSNVRIAESFANQQMILTGLKRTSQRIDLNWAMGRFKYNVTDIFNATTKDVGLLTSVTLWNDNRKPGPIWVASNITIVNLDDGSIYQIKPGKIYINKSKTVYLVRNIFRITTQSPESTSLQETLMPFSSSSESSSTETEIITLLDTSTAEATVPSTAFNYQESTFTSDTDISTDDTINSITTEDTINSITTDDTINNITSDVTSNTWTDDTMETITTNTLINTTITTTTSGTTIAISNATTATISSSTSAPMCLCPCFKKLTKKEQIEQLKEIKKELTIEKKKTSRYIRKKISVPDNRISAKATGYVGIILLICPFAAIVACDLSDLAVYLMAKYNASKV